MITEEYLGEIDPLVGLELTPRRDIQVVANVYNARAHHLRVGSRKWIETILSITRKRCYPELIPIIGTPGAPRVPPHINQILTGRKRPVIKGRTNFRFLGQQIPKRLQEAAKILRQCPIRSQSFVTVVTSPQFSLSGVWEALERDGASLDRFIRSKFPKAVYALIPEVSIHRLSDMNDGLFPDARWRGNRDPDQVVYKVHFHCVVYSPGMRPDEMESAFKTTAKGRRSRFCGENQVRALPLEIDEHSVDNMPDVLGCFGYAVKGHFSIPNKSRMIEAVPEWLLIEDHIHNHPELIRLGGTRGNVRVVCRECDSVRNLDESCSCSYDCNVVQPIEDFYGFNSSGSESNQLSTSHVSLLTRCLTILNWASPPVWNISGNTRFAKQRATLNRWWTQIRSLLYSGQGP